MCVTCHMQSNDHICSSPQNIFIMAYNGLCLAAEKSYQQQNKGSSLGKTGRCVACICNNPRDM